MPPASITPLQGDANGFNFRGYTIRRDKEGRWSLTDIWIAADRPDNRQPYEWLRISTTEELIRYLEEPSGGIPAHTRNSRKVVTTKPGTKGGTFASDDVALAYAAYLNVECHVWMLRAVRERIQEEADPELGLQRARDRAIASWKRKGRADSWINRRFSGVGKRHVLTDSLQSPGGLAEGSEYRECTEAINIPVLGGPSWRVKQRLGLSKNANLRDHLDEERLLGLELAELVSANRIREENIVGFEPCKTVCSMAGEAIALALEFVRPAKAIENTTQPKSEPRKDITSHARQ